MKISRALSARVDPVNPHSIRCVNMLELPDSGEIFSRCAGSAARIAYENTFLHCRLCRDVFVFCKKTGCFSGENSLSDVLLRFFLNCLLIITRKKRTFHYKIGCNVLKKFLMSWRANL